MNIVRNDELCKLATNTCSFIEKVKGGIYMFTLLLLSIAFILIFAFIFTVFSVGGAALMIIFGDLIVAIAIIFIIVKLIRKLKNR